MGQHAMLRSLYMLVIGLLFPNLTNWDDFAKRPVLSWEVRPDFWELRARSQLHYASQLFPHISQRRAKNVILFLGDGMGLQSIAAARFFKAYKEKRFGESARMSFEQWPFSTMCRTYDLETMVTDSASSATAYLTGTKTRTGILGLTGAVNFGECRKYFEHEKTVSVLKAAAKAGLATGVVTNARITHASPAGAYSNSASREWENDAEIEKHCRNKTECRFPCECADLAFQLTFENPEINVILGGGQQNFYPNSSSLPCDATKRGTRGDGRYLSEHWLNDQHKKGRSAEYARHPEELFAKAATKPDYLLGLLAPSHLPYEVDRKPGDPSLVNLTQIALEVLQRQGKGFFLFVEGGRIDHAHHIGQAKKALEEVLAFDEAIQAAVSMVNLRETLIIVTADHSHSFQLFGEPSRFQNILDIDENFSKKTLDGKPMTPLGYMSGPGAQVNGARANQTAFNNITSKNYCQQALVPLKDAAHGGEDVAVYAIGPFSQLFHRTIDNTFIAHAMKFALCLPPYHREKPRCRPFVKTVGRSLDCHGGGWVIGSLNSTSAVTVLTQLLVIFINAFSLILI